MSPSPTRTDIVARCRSLLNQAGGILFDTGDSREVADHAVEGRIGFHFFTTRYIAVGRTAIDWSGGPDAHLEWEAQLNRFFVLAPLRKAFLATGASRYAEAARDYVADWLRAHPPRPNWEKVPYDNTLNLTIRLQMWWQMLPDFFESHAFDDALVDRLVESTSAQLVYLEKHLCASGNWRIAQAEGFLISGLVLAGHPQAADWTALGVSLLNDAFHRQVLPDGAHIERNAGYHTWMTGLFTRYWRLGRAMPELGLAMTPEVIGRMHDYALAGQRPNGSACGLHDSLGASSGSRPADWDKNYLAFRHEAGLPSTLPPPCQYFPDAGQAFLRSGWDEQSVYLTFDATVWGGGHCHLSRNAVQLCAFGRALVVDPGYLNYDARDPLMFHGRSTRAHNTVNLNGWNQSTANPSRLRFASTPGHECVTSTYEGGYWPGRYQWWFDQGHGRGLWAEHHRTMLWIRDRAVIVLDHVLRGDEPEPSSLESNWQLATGPVRLEAEAKRARTLNADANVLMLFTLLPAGSVLSVAEGQEDPPRGWLPDRTPAPQISARCPAMQEWTEDLATVLIPYRGATAPNVAAQVTGPAVNGIGTMTLTWADGSRDLVCWTRRLDRMLGRQAGIDTDAGLVHLHTDAVGRTVNAFACEGTYLTGPALKARRDMPGAIWFRAP